MLRHQGYYIRKWEASFQQGNLPVGYASALFAAAASSEASNASCTDLTTRVTHPSAYRGAEVQAPRQHSTILLTPATFAQRGSFTGPTMVGLAADGSPWSLDIPLLASSRMWSPGFIIFSLLFFFFFSSSFLLFFSFSTSFCLPTAV